MWPNMHQTLFLDVKQYLFLSFFNTSTSVHTLAYNKVYFMYVQAVMIYSEGFLFTLSLVQGIFEAAVSTGVNKTGRLKNLNDIFQEKMWSLCSWEENTSEVLCVSPGNHLYPHLVTVYLWCAFIFIFWSSGCSWSTGTRQRASLCQILMWWEGGAGLFLPLLLQHEVCCQ